MDWRPGADMQQLRLRASVLQNIRSFFAARDVLEVETPLLASSGVTDPSIESLIVQRGVSHSQPRYLQTSPEYAMKRMVAAYGEPVYQVAKAFRDGEAGSRHNPEFTLLEWYRPGFDLDSLMAEVAELVVACIGEREVHRISYRQLFMDQLQLDPFTAPVARLVEVAGQYLDVAGLDGGRDLWLDLLLSHVLEARLANPGLCFLHDFPASQAALAQITEIDGIQVAQRFELYVDGMELANGYFELTDATEQRRRFEHDNARRVQRGQRQHPIDEYLLAALAHGMSPCSGVALGVDRLLMLASGAADIGRVLAFDWGRA